jgi:transcriptional regulator with XRE-family HTH domain
MTAEIGVLLRRARLKQSMSLRSLAAKVGVSASLISQVETGKTQPSVSTLYALSNYLGLSMDDLLGNDLAPSKSGPLTQAPATSSGDVAVVPPAVQRSSDNPSIEMDNGVRWERLAVGEGGPAEPLLVTYSPGASSSIESKLMRHSGFEYAYILEGELTLQLEFDTYVLRAGDSLQFDSVRPHMYTNNGTVAARGVWHVVGRRQQNQAMPEAHATPDPKKKKGAAEVSTIVDVLQAMDRYIS